LNITDFLCFCDMHSCDQPTGRGEIGVWIQTLYAS